MMTELMKEWTNPPIFVITPCSCTCGGGKAWMVQRQSGAWEMYGCICHNTLPPNAVVKEKI